MPPIPRTKYRPLVVLDTNVTLDWLVFGDPRAATLAMAVTAGAVDWIVCPTMRAELVHTLSYPAVQRRLTVPMQSVLSRFDALARVTAEPELNTSQRPVCRDTDDQVFVDLALQHQATWLLSHDKLVRALALQAASLGLWIGPPVGFSLSTALCGP